ncbi:MAG: aspartate/glutamate racemase family protein [Hyphomicrobiaceae bacterium]
MSIDTELRSRRRSAGPVRGKSATELIEHLPFKTDGGLATKARVGLIVLASDNTIEHEFRLAFAGQKGVGLFESRIYNSTTITPETLAAMGPLITEAARLLLPGTDLDVIGYGCTSASMVLGEKKVAEEVRKAKPKAKVTNPITAAFAAFDAFKAKRIAVLTPYRADVNAIVQKYIETKGYEVPVFGSFNEENDTTVANITLDSLKRGIGKITKGRDVDMVFVSCTGLRLVEAVTDIETAVGLPVTSSNHALAWHCLRLAGVKQKRPELGRLYTK